jgi:hypothetical protein
MNDSSPSAERKLLLLAYCVLRDIPDALSKNMVRALLRNGEQVPPEILRRFPDLANEAREVRFPSSDP